MSELPISKLYILYIFKFYDSRNPKKIGMIATKPGTFSKLEDFRKVFFRSAVEVTTFLGMHLWCGGPSAHVGYTVVKRSGFLNPPAKRKKTMCFFGCSNSVVVSQLFTMTRSTWIPDISGETTLGSHDWGLRLKVSQPLSSAKKSCRRCEFLASLEWEKMAIRGFLGILRTQYFNKGTWHLRFSLGFSHTDHTNFVGTYPA